MNQPSLELAQWRSRGHHYTVSPLNLKVFAIDLGDAAASPDATALLIHGFPESSYSFHKVVDGLLCRFKRVVLIDLPGYGFSDKPGANYSYSLVAQADALLSVWQQMQVSGGHVIAHDMGTSVSTELLARWVCQLLPAWFSDSLKSVTFTNGSMVLGYAKLRLMQKLLLNKKIGPLISAQARFSLFKRTVLSAHGADGADALSGQDIDGLWENCTQQDGHQKNHHIIRYLNDRKRFEQTRWLPSLGLASQSMPIHLCWGDADQVARIEMAHYLKRSVCQQATLTVMPGAGHFCQLGSPDLWLDNILPFYDQT